MGIELETAPSPAETTPISSRTRVANKASMVLAGKALPWIKENTKPRFHQTAPSIADAASRSAPSPLRNPAAELWPGRANAVRFVHPVTAT